MNPRRTFALLLLSAAFLLSVARAETLVALAGFSELLVFDSDSPEVLFSRTQITGLQTNERLVGIDMRPATGQLYGLTNLNRLYTIDPATAVATFKFSLTPANGDSFTQLSAVYFGIDFNPVTDQLRVVSNTHHNLRINPNDGTVVTDPQLAYAAGDDHAGETPRVVDIAYSNNVKGAGLTSLFGVDSTLNQVVRIGSGLSPNSGHLFSASPFGAPGVTSIKGFEISPSGQIVAAAKVTFPGGSNTLYELLKIDLDGGETSAGIIGDGTLPIEDIAAIPSIEFSQSLYAVDKFRRTALIAVKRNGPVFGNASVEFTTSDASAHSPDDYFAVSGTLNFNGASTTQIITVPLVNSAEDNEDLIVNLTLSNVSSGVALGRRTAQLRINRKQTAERIGPQVISAGFTSTGSALTGVVLQFDRDMNASSATERSNFTLQFSGGGPKTRVSVEHAISFTQKRTVELQFSQSIPVAQFNSVQLKINGNPKTHGVTDVAGVPLASKNGKNGKSLVFKFKILKGDTLKVKDSDGDLATLSVANGGHLEALQLLGRKFQLQAWLVDAVPYQTQLTAHVERSPKGNGRLPIEELVNIDRADIVPILEGSQVIIRRATFGLDAIGE